MQTNRVDGDATSAAFSFPYGLAISKGDGWMAGAQAIVDVFYASMPCISGA
jgi:hypothetical protein